ncbi:MAG: head-tail connector protein [Alphaproteobacteria bacterium]|nr:head-tail connector protein [Alphaproteobacteria bacterium]
MHLPSPLYRLVETAPPAVEPLTLSEVKTFLRVDQSNDDNFITGLITAARMFCEAETGRALIERNYSLFLDRWPDEERYSAFDYRDAERRIPTPLVIAPRGIGLPYPPLVSVAQVNVYAADNSVAVFDASNYFVDTAGAPGRLVLTLGAVPPLPWRIANGIEIQYTAGYGLAETDVPQLLRQGMMQIIAHLYEHRGDSPDQALLASGAAAIFKPYRLASLR